jgi:hypothetical protein
MSISSDASDASRLKRKSLKLSIGTPTKKAASSSAPLSRLSPWLTPTYYEHEASSLLPGLSMEYNSTGVVSLEAYGKHVFRGAIASPYLLRAGLGKQALENSLWTTNGGADKVAAAVLAWAIENGAANYCHWFQPLGAAGMRHGQSGQVQNALYEFDANGKPIWQFNGKALLKGETDGSSYPNGGLVSSNSHFTLHTEYSLVLCSEPRARPGPT